MPFLTHATKNKKDNDGQTQNVHSFLSANKVFFFFLDD